MSNFHIDIPTGKGTLTVKSDGLYFGSVKVLPLRKAESVLGETLRAIRVVLDVEDAYRQPFPYAAAAGGSAPVGATADGNVEAGGLLIPSLPASLPAYPDCECAFCAQKTSSVAAPPYCPFCNQPTCKCWEDHVCR